MERRLSAILAADMVGYSRLMEAEEIGTLGRQKVHREELIDPEIAKFRGRIVKEMGDGVLVEFPSVVDAVQCAVQIQRAMPERERDIEENKRIRYRIGINIGDIVVDGEDIYGDGVNVASRLEQLAEPGGICISGTVYDQMRSNVEVGYETLGAVRVKNIERPIRSYRVLIEPEQIGMVIETPSRWSGSRRWFAGGFVVLICVGLAGAWWLQQTDVEPADPERFAFEIPSKPSIAVLPFTNMSDSVDQEYFADGITEDIITDISKIAGIFVVARNSTFTYKGKAVAVSQIAEELGVRYVLEGSVRRSGETVRITAKLLDALKGKHLWSERYDRNLTDIFAVQSDVTNEVVKAMQVTLRANELDRLFQRHTSNIEAYDAFVQARRIVDPPGRQSIETAQSLFRRAIALDPDFAGGYAGLSFSYSSKARLRFGPSPEDDAKLSIEFANKAIQVDKNFTWSYIALAGAHLANGDPDAAVDAAREAIRLTPGGYEEILFMGFYLNFAGQSDLAVKHLETAARLSPVDSVRGLAFLANAYFMNGDYEKSEVLRIKRIDNFPVRNPNPYVWLAATQSALGKTAEARSTAAELSQKFPNFRLSKWRYFDSYKSDEDRMRLYTAAVDAGIPE